MIITYHARKRLAERFPDVYDSIESLIEFSIPYGKKTKREYFLLNQEHEVVFVIRTAKDEIDHVRTVLTMQQAIAELGVFDKQAQKAFDFSTTIAIPTVSKKIKKTTKSSLTNLELESLAKECCEICNFIYPKKSKRKEFSQGMRKLEVSQEGIEYFWDCMMKMVYQHHSEIHQMHSRRENNEICS